MPPQFSFTQPEPRLFVPEVVQTSAMDCGPAALKCLLEGFGIPASYGRLREACQTDVDGTSINTLEDVAQQLGLRAEQMMAPLDHLLLSSAQLLPALVVTMLPNGFNHFVVVWRTHGPIVQVMDPATGRRWSTHKRFLAEVYRYTLPFSATTWRTWAASEGFIAPLEQRLGDLDLSHAVTKRLIDGAAEEPSWRGFAALDASTRMVNSIVQAGGVARGHEATRLVEEFCQQAQQAAPEAPAIIPDPFWSVRPLSPAPNGTPATDGLLLLQGAVLLKISGREDSAAVRPPEQPQAEPPDTTRGSVELQVDTGLETEAESPLPTPDEAETTHSTTRGATLTAALSDTTRQPEWAIIQALRQDGLLTPALLTSAALLAAVGVTVEAALLRGLMVLVADAKLGVTRFALFGGLVAFVAMLLLLELPIATTVLRMGRRLEARIRIAFLEKIPRLSDRYFHSRLISDMAQRAYGLHQLHALPDLAMRYLRLCSQLIFTTGGIIWLYPGAAPLALAAMIGSVGGALLIQPMQTERDMRVRTHNGALSRFYLDALLGLMPIRTHSAERAVRREHEMLLVAWARESLALARIQTLAQSLAAFIGIGFAIWIVLGYIISRGEASGVLLLLYWTLNLPALGQSLATSARQYPMIRNSMRRVLEPLGTPEEDEGVTEWQGDKVTSDRQREVSPLHPFTPSPLHTLTLSLEDVTVHAGGHVILEDVNLAIQPGEHVAIVGPSGAGKSSLVGLLLGWHRPAVGRVLVNGEPLVGEQLQTLRRMTAWVDPSVQLWNRPLQENLRYGHATAENSALGKALQEADLYDVLDRLPHGLQTPLGEGGGLVSGGEGQRVRLGRALLHPDVHLVILDEPFRGLDRAKRRQLLANAREQWRDATLLCITHDVAETQDFARVLVIEDGCIVEDGAPQTLADQPSSRYGHLLKADESVRRQRWTDTAWRRLWLAGGVLRDASRNTPQKQAIKQDDLQQIKGIGPTFAKRLHQAGIHTVADLAKLTAEEVREVLATSGRAPPVNPQAWIEQAQRLTGRP